MERFKGCWSGLSSVPIEFPCRCISVNPCNCTYEFPRKCISVNPRNCTSEFPCKCITVNPRKPSGIVSNSSENLTDRKRDLIIFSKY